MVNNLPYVERPEGLPEKFAQPIKPLGRCVILEERNREGKK
jgi:hypothetical protein